MPERSKKPFFLNKFADFINKTADFRVEIANYNVGIDDFRVGIADFGILDALSYVTNLLQSSISGIFKTKKPRVPSVHGAFCN